jgi:hypothetical protein
MAVLIVDGETTELLRDRPLHSPTDLTRRVQGPPAGLDVGWSPDRSATTGPHLADRCLGLGDVGGQLFIGGVEFLPPHPCVAALPASEVGGEIFDMYLVSGAVGG